MAQSSTTLTRCQRCAPLMSRAVLHPELLALKQHDVHLAHALATSRRVGSALLKAEEEEAGKLKALTDEMLSKHR